MSSDDRDGGGVTRVRARGRSCVRARLGPRVGGILRRGAAGALGAMVGLACASSPTEAPPPNAASTWPEAEVDPGPVDEPPVAHAPTRAPPRPRPPDTIFRDEVELATARGPAYLLRQLGPEPFRHDGQFVGWEITRLFPDEPTLCVHACDLEIGDVVLGVNGLRLQTPQELSRALELLPEWTTLEVHSLRKGQRRQVTYTIVVDPTRGG